MDLMLFNWPCDFKGEFQVARSAPGKTTPRKNGRWDIVLFHSKHLSIRVLKPGGSDYLETCTGQWRISRKFKNPGEIVVLGEIEDKYGCPMSSDEATRAL